MMAAASVKTGIGYTSGCKAITRMTRYDNLPTIAKTTSKLPVRSWGGTDWRLPIQSFLMGNKTAHFRIEIGYGYRAFPRALNFAGFSDATSSRRQLWPRRHCCAGSSLRRPAPDRPAD